MYAKMLVTGDDQIERCMPCGFRPASATLDVAEAEKHPAFAARVEDASHRIEAGQPLREIIERHGFIVVREAKTRLEKSRQGTV